VSRPRDPVVKRRRDAGAGLVLLGVVAVIVFALFGGRSPVGSSAFALHALVRSDAQLAPGSAVRVAGVEVGKVTAVEAESAGAGIAEVTMEIRDAGLPLRSGTTLKIRPRLLLEGNFFVDLRPGAGSSSLRSGATLPVTATAGPVQLDRVLTGLPSAQRARLQAVLQGVGSAYGDAAPSLNRALRDFPATLRGTALVTEALQGRSAHDLSGAVAGSARVFGALARSEDRLAALVTNFDATMAAFASRSAPLRRTVAELPRLTSAARPALARVDRALPPTRAFARALRPGVAELPAFIAAARPWIGQARALVSQAEIGGLVADLQPAIAATARVVDAAPALVRSVDGIDKCFLRTLLPISEQAVDDPPLSTGVPVWNELLQGIAAVGGAAQNFDGNGAYVRGQTAGGAFPVKTSALPEQGVFFGNAVRPPIGTRPRYPAKEPPLRFDVPCTASAIPSLRADTGVGP
jgi:phospholipid/cholesterol/gamma-HCH transport system substrate-binding protein